MGMYTRLQLDVEIYPDYVEEVERYVESVPRLRCSSYYFYDRGENKIVIDDTAKCLRNPNVEPTRENVLPMAVLHVDISCKNYGMEIQEFLKFLEGKVVSAGGYDEEQVGLIRYEEDKDPKLIYREHMKLVIKEIKVVA